MNETRKIRIYVGERETIDKETKKKKKFKVYHTFSKNGRKTEVKFRQEVKNTPDENCYILVNYEDMNLNTGNQFPVLWIKKVLDILDINEELAEKSRQKIDDYFGDEESEEVEESDEE